MPKRIKITEEQLRNIVHEALCESMSISDDVLMVTHNVMRAIRNELNKKEGQDGITTGVFSIRLFNSTFSVQWTLYDKTKIDTPPIGASIDFKNKILSLDLIKDNNGLNKGALADSLQHEIEHLYQKLKRPNEEIFNDKDSDLYEKVVKQLSITKPKTLEHNIARCIYLMFNAEQDAYANGLYAMLVNDSYYNFNHNCHNNHAVSQLRFLTDFYNKTIDLKIEENNDDEYINALEPFNRSITWFLNHLDKAIRRFSRKLSRVKDKAYSELNDEMVVESMMYSVKNHIKQKKK